MEEFLKEKTQQFLGYEILIMKILQNIAGVVILLSDKRAVLPISGKLHHDKAFCLHQRSSMYKPN